MIELYKLHFADIISEAMKIIWNLQVKSSDILSLIEIPPENIPGDLTFPCFQISKTLKKAPNEIAKNLAMKLSSPFTHFTSFTAIGWYINAHINPSDFINNFFNLTRDSKLVTRNSKNKVLIEYMNANPNKPLHIWQARNVCIGDSMRRIFRFLGYDVHAADYGDDSGVNVGYNIVGHLYYDYPTLTDMKYDHYCGKIYEEMRKKEEDPVFKKQLLWVLQKIESADPEIYEIHKTYTKKCTEEQIHSCRRLWASFDVIIRETSILHRKFFAETMEILKDKWYVKFIDEGDAKGCRVIDLSSLPKYAKEDKQYQILIKSDGVASYIGKDISLAMRKLGYLNDNFAYEVFTHEPDENIIYTSTGEKPKDKTYQFGNYDTAITVIDNRQIPAQTIVHSALRLLGFLTKKKQYSPLGYGVVYLTPQTLIKLWYKLSEEEKAEKRLPFSSRKWRTVTLDEMLEMLHQKAYFETRERNPEKGKERLDATAEKIAIWSLRFFLIKWDITKDIIFDVDEVLNMEGETGAYVMYTWARIQSIIDQSNLAPLRKGLQSSKAGEAELETKQGDLLTSPYEFNLVKKLAEFDETILRAKTQLAPHLISRYLFELSAMTNIYYAHVKVLTAEEKIKNARILLLHKTRETLKKWTDLIGVPFLERM